MQTLVWRRSARAVRPALVALESRIVPTTDLILDFDGGVLLDNQGYAFPDGFGINGTNTFTGFSSFGAVPGGGGSVNRTEQILQIVAGVRMDYADFDVRVIWDDRGVQSPFYDGLDTVVMTVGEDQFGLFGIAASVDLTQSLRDVALAFQPAHENLDFPATARRSLRELIDTISHESGHNLGLSHTTQADAEMRQLCTVAPQNTDLDSRFSTQQLAHGGEGVYAERDRLFANLGPALLGTTLTVNETATNQTLPVDTAANNFNGPPLALPGAIDFAGDRDAFRIVFATAGTFNVRLTSDFGQSIEPIFTVWDVHGDWILTSGQGPAGGGSFTKNDITVTAGQTIYVVVGSSSGQAGDGTVSTPILGTYTLTIGPADGDGIGFGTPPVLPSDNLVATGGDAGSPPIVRVYNAVGTMRREILAYDLAFTGGVRVALADLNGDTVLDVITGPGTGGGPHVRAFDGVTGLVLAEFFPFHPAFRGGVYVAGGDLNGDGRDDIVVAAGTGGGPHVRAFSGLDGRLLFDGLTYAASFRGGVNVAVGDVNGDGFGDIVTGAGTGGGPHVRAFSGRNGASLLSFLAYDALFTGGITVAAGDVDGDGLADIVTGPAVGSSHLRVFSGADAQVMTEFLAFPAPIGTQTAGLGAVGVRVGVFDFDGDGLMDIVAAPSAGARPVVQSFRGLGGALLGAFNAFDPIFLGGVFVGG